jgi:nucleotide-binding universal stress UspA family protein
MVALAEVEHVHGLVEIACRLATSAEAEIIALHVVEIGPGLPLDAHAEILDQPGRELLAHARRAALENGFSRFTTELVRARLAGKAIVEEARERDINLLILGYHKRHGLAHMLAGSTMEYAARHAPCAMIVHIQPSAEARLLVGQLETTPAHA